MLVALQYATDVAFALLGIVAIGDWLRYRTRRHFYLAIALASLGAVAALGVVTQLLAAAHVGSPQGIRLATIALFPLSGWGLLMFRHTFLRLSVVARVVAPLALAAPAAALAFLLDFYRPLQSMAVEASTLLLVAAWSICVGEPSLRFWLAARGLPVVQRRRLRALSYGYAGLIFVLVVAAANPRARGGVSIAISVIALLAVPALYAAFSPPRLLRLLWRDDEEEAYRSAVNDLVVFAPDRETLARRALEWATRLVGASGGAVLEPDGSVLAVSHLNPAVAERLAEQAGGTTPEAIRAGADGRPMVDLPLNLDTGEGHLVVLAGPFTPLFATEEIARLREYGATLSVALDRARLSERMRALEDTKSRFLRLASHELRGPLTLIRGYISMLDEGAIAPEELHSMTALLMSRVTQMTNMLNEMLETARLEDERLELNVQPCDLGHLAQSVVRVMSPLATAHELTAEVPPEPVLVLCDPARVENILTILVDNAIKYSPGAGKVCCTVRKDEDGGIAEVIDEGVGIAPEDMPSLFTRFGRLQNPATSSVPGTGLGLYLSRELARRQGGDVGVVSEPGRGSRFSLRLPLAEKGAPVA